MCLKIQKTRRVIPRDGLEFASDFCVVQNSHDISAVMSVVEPHWENIGVVAKTMTPKEKPKSFDFPLGVIRVNQLMHRY